MNKKTYICLGFIFLFILSLNALISSAPPFQVSSVNSGCEIDYSKIEVIKLNQAHTFNFHVINSSNGVSLTNTTLQCVFHLYNKTGKHIFLFNTTYEHDYDYQAYVAGGNFSVYGEMSYILQCNNSVTGCFVSIPLKVTSTGYEVSIAQIISIFLGVFLILSIGFFLFVFGLYSQMPVKLFSLCLAVILIVFALGFGLNVLNNSVAEYSNLTNNFTNVYTLFIVLMTMGGLGVILFLIVLGVTYFSKLRGFKD